MNDQATKQASVSATSEYNNNGWRGDNSVSVRSGKIWSNGVQGTVPKEEEKNVPKEQTIKIEGKKFTVDQLKAMIEKAQS